MRVFPALCAFLLNVGYVVVLYVLPQRVRSLPRNHPTHVLARLGAVGAYSLLAPLPLWYVLEGSPAPHPTLYQALGVAWGCYTASPLAAMGPTLLLCALFAGPLVEVVLRGMMGREGPGEWDLHLGEGPLIPLRNLLVGPITEEWVFRGCTVPLWTLAGLSPGGTVAATCASFGVMHAHHYWELIKGGDRPTRAAMRVLVQVAYTSLFAAIVTQAFQRSGSLWGVVGAHTLANFMGLPSLAFATEPTHPCYGVRWVVWGGYAGGIGAFLHLLWGDWLWRGAACGLSTTTTTTWQ